MFLYFHSSRCIILSTSGKVQGLHTVINERKIIVKLQINFTVK